MLFALTFLCSFISVFAHQSSLDAGGNELHWVNKNIPLAIKTNTFDLSSAEINSVILNSMNQWNAVTSAKLNSVGSATNEISFVKNFPYGAGVLGLTELSYTGSGVIQSASVILNDDFTFHSAPGLYPTGHAFLGDVVTHELGHLLGLSHSEVLNSSMFYSSYSGQSTLSADDKSGVRNKYDNTYGVISGHVKGGQSVGVLGVHVQAISRNTGESSAAVSDENGFFRIGGLDLDDTYYLYTSPLKNPSSLPSYFSNSQDEFCPAAYVGSFFQGCGKEHEGKPQGITLTNSHSSVDVGTVTINCSLKSDQSYNYQKLQTTFSPVTVFDYDKDQRSEKGFVGWFRKSALGTWSISDELKVDLTSFYDLGGNTKYLKISLVSYPFGSQSEYEMTVKKNNSLTPSATKTLTYSSVTQTYSTDFHSLMSLSTDPLTNIFDISIKARKLSTALSSQTFPDFGQFSNDKYLPYLVIVSLYELTPQGMMPILDSGVNLSDNESCLDAPFTYGVSRAISTSGNESQNTAQGVMPACGTIDPPNSGSGNSLPLMSLGFLLTLFASRFLKTRKKFLS